MSASENYRRRQLLGFIVSIALTGIGIYRFPNIWINKSDLVQLKGTVRSARTHVSTSFSESKRYRNEPTISRVSTLVFQLNQIEQEFHLADNIGKHYIHEEHEKILRGLRNADSVSVWIKKDEQDAGRPKVYQIHADETTLLDFKHLHIRNDPETAVLIGMGVFFTILCSAAFFRERNAV